MTNHNDDMLDDIFASSRSAPCVPDEALTARVLADAQAIQAGFAATPLPEQPGLWSRILDALGGWPSVGGLATATIAGVWIGVVPPQSVSDITAAFLGDEVSISLVPVSYGFESGALADG